MLYWVYLPHKVLSYLVCGGPTCDINLKLKAFFNRALKPRHVYDD